MPSLFLSKIVCFVVNCQMNLDRNARKGRRGAFAVLALTKAGVKCATIQRAKLGLTALHIWLDAWGNAEGVAS